MISINRHMSDISSPTIQKIHKLQYKTRIVLLVYIPLSIICFMLAYENEIKTPLIALAIIIRIIAVYVSIVVQNLLNRKVSFLEIIIHISVLGLPILSLIMDSFPYKKQSDIIP